MNKPGSAGRRPLSGCVCPWWFIRSFDNPLRRLIHDPDKLLAGIVRPGDRVLDVGCGYGYFTIPAARLVGPSGAVTAVDLQPQMLAGVERRARQAGLATRIHLRRVTGEHLDVRDEFDVALAFWMLHEVRDQRALLDAIHAALRPGGRLLLVEPRGHVGARAFGRAVEEARRAGFMPLRAPRVALSRALLLVKDAGAGRE